MIFSYGNLQAIVSLARVAGPKPCFIRLLFYNIFTCNINLLHSLAEQDDI